MGAGGAVCFASGFREVGGDGAGRQERLIAAAGAMSMMGPNCHGFVDYIDGAALWPDQHGGARVERGVALITQSGNMAINLSMQQRALPLAYLVTLGNQAMIGIPECVESLAADERITAIRSPCRTRPRWPGRTGCTTRCSSGWAWRASIPSRNCWRP
jgi:acyl-CoA synthetase (NDP forming)